MKVVIQKVKRASVTIEEKLFSKINDGYLLLVGFNNEDTIEIIPSMVQKIMELRICEDNNGKMNLSIQDTKGAILSVSQFTLYADASHGRRPSFTNALKAEEAKKYYELFNDELKKYGLEVQTGVFQANMQVELINDGPITIILDSKEVIR